MLPGRNILNLGLFGGNIAAMAYYMMSANPTVGLAMLGATTGLSSIMGITLTMAIGGKDQAPVPPRPPPRPATPGWTVRPEFFVVFVRSSAEQFRKLKKQIIEYKSKSWYRLLSRGEQIYHSPKPFEFSVII